MSQPLAHERKTCPQCGHSSRASVKICPQCGYAFLSNTSGILRKRCTACGHMNRMGAKVCSLCGKGFDNSVNALQSEAQKWCPQCGKRRNPNAKVCSNCGYRFKVAAAVPPTPPVVQAETQSEPINVKKVTSAPQPPKPRDLSGEPAPYISPDELKRLRDMGAHDPGLFVRLYHVLRDNKS